MRINQDVEFLWISALLTGIMSVKGQDGCKLLQFLDCLKNKAFSGHVIKTVKLSSELETCRQKCFIEDNCVSYNLGPIEGKIKSCELSDADHLTYPGDVVSKQGFEYCTFKNPCSSNPCPVGKISLPDASWSNCVCRDGRWSEWSSWGSCFCDSQTRTRLCLNPFSQKNATDCIGPYEDKQECVMNAEPSSAAARLCIFPFFYQNVWYDRCTCVNHDRPWCSTLRYYISYNWENCAYTRT